MTETVHRHSLPGKCRACGVFLTKQQVQEVLMADRVEICVVCAWRATCQKRFSISGKNMRCADFVKDVTIKEKPAKEEKKEEGKG